MMDGNVIAAIIAATIAVLTGIVNIFLTIHRNKQDGITTYRMNWINDVRNGFSNILSWTYYTNDTTGNLIVKSIDELSKSVYKISLLLNVRDDYDKEILDKSIQYLEHAKKTQQVLFLGKNIQNNELLLLMLSQGNEEIEKMEPLKKELQKLIRVYLKTEWTRIKLESSIWKIPYLYCWKPFRGFNAEDAIKKFTKEYKDF